MPIATALTLVELDLTTNNLAACIAMPVLSRTLLGKIVASYSRYSSLAGVLVAHTANLTCNSPKALFNKKLEPAPLSPSTLFEFY